MNKPTFLAFILLSSLSIALQQSFPSLVAKVRAASGTFTTGQVVVTPTGATGARLEINIGGLTANRTVALHVHQFGDLTVSDGTGAGGHFNPFNVEHGCAPSPIRHVGDVGNITADSKGLVSTTLTSELISLDPNSRSYVGGLAVIIHATFDDCVTKNTGNAGVRIGMGVLGFTRGSVLNATDEATAGKTPEVYGCSFLEPSGLSGKVVFLYVNETTALVNLTGLPPRSYFTMKITNTGGLRYETRIMDKVWNYDNSDHGCPGASLKYQAGDLGSFMTEDNGTALFYVVLPKLSLFPNTMKSPLGRSLYLLTGKDSCAASDDDASLQPLATCVIGEYSPVTNTPRLLVNVPRLSPIVSSASSLLSTFYLMLFVQLCFALYVFA